MLRLVCHTRRLTIWIVLFSVLFGVLAPAVSRAVASDNPEIWVEICTAAGVRFIALSELEGEAGSGSDAVSNDGYCPYCMSQVTAGLPPSGLPQFEPVLVEAFVPPAFLDAPRTPFAWLSVRSRAPPSFAPPG